MAAFEPKPRRPRHSGRKRTRHPGSPQLENDSGPVEVSPEESEESAVEAPKRKRQRRDPKIPKAMSRREQKRRIRVYNQRLLEYAKRKQLGLAFREFQRLRESVNIILFYSSLSPYWLGFHAARLFLLTVHPISSRRSTVFRQ